MKNSFLAVICLLALGFTLQRARALDGSQRVVCGTNVHNEIYCTSYQGMEHGRWERLPGALKQVLVREGQLWGVTGSGDIYYSPDFRSSQWVHLQGSAKELSEGHGVLCAVTNKDEVWCADQGITTPTPQWKKAPNSAGLKLISVN